MTVTPKLLLYSQTEHPPRRVFVGVNILLFRDGLGVIFGRDINVLSLFCHDYPSIFPKDISNMSHSVPFSYWSFLLDISFGHPYWSFLLVILLDIPIGHFFWTFWPKDIE